MGFIGIDQLEPAFAFPKPLQDSGLLLGCELRRITCPVPGDLTHAGRWKTGAGRNTVQEFGEFFKARVPARQRAGTPRRAKLLARFVRVCDVGCRMLHVPQLCSACHGFKFKLEVRFRAGPGPGPRRPQAPCCCG